MRLRNGWEEDGWGEEEEWREKENPLYVPGYFILLLLVVLILTGISSIHRR